MAQEKLISLNNLSTFKDNVDVLLNNKDSYGVCNTAANVAAKTVSHSTFVLTNGVSISVKFVNSNTAENPTLNVNNTGAKAIYRFGTTKPGITEATSWTAGSIVTLTYDGTNWIMNDVQEAEEYERITYQQWLNMTPAEKAASNYFIPDYPSMSFDAGDIGYDNTTSGLIGNNVQSAIDEVKGLIDEGGSQVQSDWTEDDTTSKAYIQHKPTLGSAASKDVPTSGNASTTEVVMGNDTRLSDSRNAADVYSWAKAETKPSYTANEVGAIASTEKGANSGVAELDSAGKVPSSQLPSYVDDVIEYDSLSDFPLAGESGKIYIAKDTNITYRWSGTAYVAIGSDLALGETSSTAYRGDRGKIAYDHSQVTSGNPHNVTKAEVGLGNVANLNQFEGTLEEWEALTTEQKIAYDEYKIDNDYVEPTNPDADDINYDNTTSGLVADNVQSAIDEVNSLIAALGLSVVNGEVVQTVIEEV